MLTLIGVSTILLATNIVRGFTHPTEQPPLGYPGPLSIQIGGTSATTTAGARTNLGAAAAGANTDITSIDPYTGNPLQVGTAGIKFSNGTVQTAAASASQWTTSGSNIYYNTGSVGIGVTSPTTAGLVVSKLVSGVSIDAGNGRIADVSAPTASTDAATKAYVDAATGGAVEVKCPVSIDSSDRPAATFVNAVTTCRNLGGTWRLPTAEELSCFMGISGATSNYLWTRTPLYFVGNVYNTYLGGGYYVATNLSNGYWTWYSYYTTYNFRCVQ
ncbi:MAG: hypothetical protein KGJ01_02490 [Patescibacteria group bacterium]|nr:hypothetical protein [Patescibacteria group bacterium]